MKKFFLTAVALVFAFCAKAEIPVGYGLPHVAPEAVGMSSDRLSKIDDIVNDAIARKDFPGAVVAVVRGQQICYMKAYGKKGFSSIYGSCHCVKRRKRPSQGTSIFPFHGSSAEFGSELFHFPRPTDSSQGDGESKAGPV